MRTEQDIHAELANIAAQQQYLADTIATIEANSESGDYADDWDFSGDLREMTVELDAREEALRFALGTSDITVPTNYAEAMCTGHGYPEKADA
jgi:hypothetical protein